MLSPDAYRVLREQGTEPRFSGEFGSTTRTEMRTSAWGMRCTTLRFRGQVQEQQRLAELLPAGGGIWRRCTHGPQPRHAPLGSRVQRLRHYLGHVFEKMDLLPRGFAINSVALDFVPRDSVAVRELAPKLDID